MAHAVAAAPILRLKRSTQSGVKAMAAVYTVVYTESSISAMAYIFAGAEIDLTNMQALDVIDIRVRKVIIFGGGWVNHDEKQYAGVQPAGHPAIHINPIPDTYGVSIEMRQTGGVSRSIPVEMYDAKRLGMP